ncbi:MAG: hypothetical protein HY309_10625 [Pseudomonas fluorescens]|nr:hypothetical protein [Pseudomonas fluorescens]
MAVAKSSFDISANFDSGNIQVIDLSDPLKPLLAIRPDTKSNHFQWFHFKASGLHVGQEHWFRLNNASQSSYNKAWTGYQAVASYDHVNWFRIPTIFEGDCLRFSLEAEQTHAWFAYFEPYSRGRHDWLIEQALTKAGTELLATGKSVEGRDIQLLRKGTGAEDLFLDAHGDEEIPHVFTAGCEGNPGYTPRIEKLEEQFRSHLKHTTKDFQTKYGYTRDEPGQANMTLACNSVGQKYDCLSLTLEMPFKDHDDHPNPLTGWSGKRSKQLGKDVLTTVADMVDTLR